MDLLLAQYRYGFEGTWAVYLFIAGFVCMLLLAAVVLRLSLAMWLFAGMLFFAALTPAVDWIHKTYVQTWMVSVQAQRKEMFLACGVGMTLLLLGTGRLNLGRMPAAGVVLLLMGLYAGTLQMIHETPTEGVLSIGYALATIPAAVLICREICRDYDGCLKLVRTMMWVSVVWAVCCSIQFVINPRLLVSTAGRFWGLLGNAQQAAILCAPWAVMAMWLLLNDPQRRTRPLWVALVGVNLLFVAWTASRTGFLMTVLGMTGVLYSRLGRAVLLLPVAGGVLAGLYVLAENLGIMSNVERLVSTENTRAGVWASQIGNIVENPLIGVGWHNTGGSESSYLGGFAAYGVVMMLLMVALVTISGVMLLTLVVRKRALPRQQRPIVDLAVGFCVMYFAGAQFEGYLMARNGTTQVMMFAILGIMSWALAATREAQQLGEVYDDGAEPFEDYASEAYSYGDYGDLPAPRGA